MKPTKLHFGYILVFAALLVCVTRGDYDGPWFPDWGGIPAYSSQFWSLRAVDGNEPNQPLLADNFLYDANNTNHPYNFYYDNPYGQPTAVWQSDPPHVMWGSPMGAHPDWVDWLYGGMVEMAGGGPYTLTATIPTGSESGSLKVLVQYDWYDNGSVTASVPGAVDVTSSGWESIELGTSGSGIKWYRTTSLFEFSENPGLVTAILSLSGTSPLVDSFSVTTAAREYSDLSYQRWDFGNGDGNDVSPPPEPNLPLIADGGLLNEFGDPCLIDVEFTNPNYSFWAWIPVGQPDAKRRALYGGMQTNVTLDFKIPGIEKDDKKKLIVVNLYYWADTAAGGDVVEVSIAPDESFEITFDTPMISEQIEVLLNEEPGSSGRWFRYTGRFGLAEHPSLEYVRVAVLNDFSLATMVDTVQIDVHTINLGDMDYNGAVGFKDYAFFAQQWGKSGESLAADLFPDGNVDEKDLAVFLADWLKGW